jgi:prevent-host-death family protein
MNLPAAQFRLKFFELLDLVGENGEEIVITKHGKPIARLCPVEKDIPDPWGCMRGTAQVIGDIESPILPSVLEWGTGE